MKAQTTFFTALAICATALTLFAQTASTPSSDTAVTAVIEEIQTQQKAIAENQGKIDEKLAAIAEEIRLARLFVARGGNKGAK